MLYIKGNLSREETTQDLLAVFPEAMVALGEARDSALYSIR